MVEARQRIKPDIEYNRACFEATCGNVEEALALLQVALKKKQETSKWVQRDPDFESLHGDPRFQELIKNVEGRTLAS